MLLASLLRTGRHLAVAVVLVSSLSVAGCVAAPTAATRAAAATPSAASTMRADRCSLDQLSISVDSSRSGQQTIEPAIVLVNAGRRACTLQGVPTVSFVTARSGRRIGPAGFRETMLARPEITLQPRAAAESALIVDFPDKDARACGQVDAAGFSMTLPAARHAVFIAYPYPACRLKRLIAVFPFRLR